MTELQLKKISVEGFKSIRSLKDFELRPVNVLIGANGAGKSNLLSVFPFMRADARGYLDKFVAESGGADIFCFQGPKMTQRINVEYEIGHFWYGSEFEWTTGNDLFRVQGHIGGRTVLDRWDVPSDAGQSVADLYGDEPNSNADDIRRIVSNWVTYHFHDTSRYSGIKRDQNARHDRLLEPDGSNIAAYLRAIKETDVQTYNGILSTVRSAAPFIDDFILEPRTMGQEEKVRLEWKQKGSDYPFQPYQLSDGTLRFICLAVALSQPVPPPIIIVDEPELGLHPMALELFAAMVRQASAKSQIILSTQSPTLLNHFEPDEIIVAQRDGAESTFSRLNEKELEAWLADYTLGDLWQKNVIEGGPTFA